MVGKCNVLVKTKGIFSFEKKIGLCEFFVRFSSFFKKNRRLIFNGKMCQIALIKILLSFA